MLAIVVVGVAAIESASFETNKRLSWPEAERRRIGVGSLFGILPCGVGTVGGIVARRRRLGQRPDAVGVAWVLGVTAWRQVRERN